MGMLRAKTKPNRCQNEQKKYLPLLMVIHLSISCQTLSKNVIGKIDVFKKNFFLAHGSNSHSDFHFRCYPQSHFFLSSGILDSIRKSLILS